jgi:hypothetical protein
MTKTVDAYCEHSNIACFIKMYLCCVAGGIQRDASSIGVMQQAALVACMIISCLHATE